MSNITDLLAEGAGNAATGYGGGFVLGTVAENANKEFPAMVKVEFTAWAENKNITAWMPVLFSYAGKEHGRYLMPEVNDIVVIGFMGPMMESPFVIGSLYPAGSSIPGAQYDDKNLNRCIKTKGGVSLTVRDEDGKQRWEAKTPKGLTVRATDESETIAVTDEKGKNCLTIDCKGGAIAVTAEKKMTLKAGKCEIVMDGNSGELVIKGGQIKVEASQTANIKSSNMLTVEGGVLKVEGKQQLALKSSAICEIAGGMVKIN